MRYVLLSTPGGHEWEMDTELVVDTLERRCAPFNCDAINVTLRDDLNAGNRSPEPFMWEAWDSFALDVDDKAWAEHHGETFEGTTARLFNDLPVQGEKQHEVNK